MPRSPGRPTRWFRSLASLHALLAKPLPLLGQLRAKALFLLPELGSELGAEIRRLEDLANFDLGLRASGIGAALDPFDRFLLRLHLNQPEAGDQLLRLGEGPVDHGPLRSGELDARALGARLEPLAREQHAGFDELFVVLPH